MRSVFHCRLSLFRSRLLIAALQGFLIGAGVAALTGTTHAQVDTFRPVRAGAPATAADGVRDTQVKVELLIGKGEAGLKAQQWGQVFERLEVPVRIRRSILDEQPEIKERMYGRLRQVTVIGLLARDGTLVFPEHTFRQSEIARLREWLRELQTYGAQGAPDGKPLWGLSKSQFGELYDALSGKLEQEVEGRTLNEALATFDLPKQYPLRFSTSAQERLRDRFPQKLPPVHKRLQGVGKGTALALLLNDYGLGFRPLRTPDGSLELTVESLEETEDVWPVGWKFKQSRAKTAPKLFELIPVHFEDVKLLDVFDAVSAKTGIPIYLDRYRIDAKGIDLESIRVSYPPRQASWSLLLHGITNPHKLARRFRIDEQGRPFVWITTLEPGRISH